MVLRSPDTHRQISIRQHCGDDRYRPRPILTLITLGRMPIVPGRPIPVPVMDRPLWFSQRRFRRFCAVADMLSSLSEDRALDRAFLTPFTCYDGGSR
jgi:hypothetical protein